MASTVAAAAAMLAGAAVMISGFAIVERTPGMGAVSVILFTVIAASLAAIAGGAVAAAVAFRRLCGSALPGGEVALIVLATIGAYLFTHSTPSLVVVTVPLVWTVPAAVLGALRRRVVVGFALLGLLAFGVGHGVSAQQQQQEADRVVAAYDGPWVLPSGGRTSPLPDWEFRSVTKPASYAPDSMELQWRRSEPDTEANNAYTVTVARDLSLTCSETESRGEAAVGRIVSGCEMVWAETEDGWVVEIGSYGLSEAEKLVVLSDLRPATADQVRDVTA